METNSFDLVILTLESGLLVEYFNLINNIWIVFCKAFIIHMIIPCGKIFEINFKYINNI